MSGQPTFDEVWPTVDDVDGWMTREQAAALFHAAHGCRDDGTIVEIGSFRGRSTIVLALAAPTSARIVAIDPHAGTDRGPQEFSGYAEQAEDDHTVFVANLERAGVSDRVEHLRMFSDAALGELDGPVDVLHIDGAHRFAPARADIRDWGARVADGGVMLVHDSFSSVGVTLASVRELLVSRRFEYVGRSRSLATYRASPDVVVWRNALRQLAQLPWFGWNLALKVLITIRVLRHTEWPY